IELRAVAVLTDRIHPDEHTVDPEQLRAHLIGDFVAVVRSLDVETDVAERFRDAAEPRFLELHRRTGARIPGEQHRHSILALAHLMPPRSCRGRLSLQRSLDKGPTPGGATSAVPRCWARLTRTPLRGPC